MSRARLLVFDPATDEHAMLLNALVAVFVGMVLLYVYVWQPKRAKKKMLWVLRQFFKNENLQSRFDSNTELSVRGTYCGQTVQVMGKWQPKESMSWKRRYRRQRFLKPGQGDILEMTTSVDCAYGHSFELMVNAPKKSFLSGSWTWDKLKQHIQFQCSSHELRLLLDDMSVKQVILQLAQYINFTVSLDRGAFTLRFYGVNYPSGNWVKFMEAFLACGGLLLYRIIYLLGAKKSGADLITPPVIHYVHDIPPHSWGAPNGA